MAVPTAQPMEEWYLISPTAVLLAGAELGSTAINPSILLIAIT
jgi:hypothetical protein